MFIRISIVLNMWWLSAALGVTDMLFPDCEQQPFWEESWKILRKQTSEQPSSSH